MTKLVSSFLARPELLTYAPPFEGSQIKVFADHIKNTPILTPNILTAQFALSRVRLVKTVAAGPGAKTLPTVSREPSGDELQPGRGGGAREFRRQQPERAEYGMSDTGTT